MSIDEYQSYLKTQPNIADSPNEALEFIKEHFEELKSLLDKDEKELVLNPKVYNPKSEYVNKSLQINKEVFENFSNFISTKFPHYRQRDLISQSLLEFQQKYTKAPPQ